tara:strand:- start:216 stop:641 length:426 start_codon:yes stop_codon:yes gene_type:complete
MARRRSAKRKAPRRSRTVSALNVLESYMYAHILSQGLAGTSPIGLVTGKTDLESVSYDVGAGGLMSSKVMGADVISLGDIVQSPGLALEAFSSNFMNNYQSMAVQSIVTGVTFKFGKRLLRRPISNINRNIMKPLGVGIKL